MKKTGPICTKGTKPSASSKPIKNSKGIQSMGNAKEGRIVGPPVATAKGLKAVVTKHGWLRNATKHA